MVNPPIIPNKKNMTATQKDVMKDNAIALKFLLDGLPKSVKESIGEHTSAKDLWFKLQSEYQHQKRKAGNKSQAHWRCEARREERPRHK